VQHDLSTLAQYSARAAVTLNDEDPLDIPRKTNLVLVILLGITAAIPKVMQMPHEVEFFHAAGLGAYTLVAFGLAQLAGGILLLFPRTRKWGAIAVAATFAISTGMLFMAGNIAVGSVSAVTVLMAGFVAGSVDEVANR